MFIRAMGFLSSPPEYVTFGSMLLSALFCFQNRERLDRRFLYLLLYIPLGILLASPDPIFKSVPRYILFLLLCLSVGPVFQGSSVRMWRKSIMKASLWICVWLAVGSFVCYFLGINFMVVHNDLLEIRTGTFGGLTPHSMLLGPIASISTVFLVYKAYQEKKKWYWALAIASMGSILFSASRSALVCCIAGTVMMLYLTSARKGKFMKSMLLFTILVTSTFPLWESATDMVMEKSMNNIEMGGLTASRDIKWINRWEEYESSPIWGIGFDAVDLDHYQDYSFQTGQIEPGTSWLTILSMLGTIGALLLLPIFYRCFKACCLSGDKSNALLGGLLMLFAIHMIVEGYIFSAGGFLCYILWLTIGNCYDVSYENRPKLKIKK